MLDRCKIMLRWPKTRRSQCGRLREARKWGGGRRGVSKVGGGLGMTRGRGVGAVKARAPAVTSLHRFTVRRHLATLRHGGWPPLCHPLAPLAAARRGHPPRGRGRHFEKWFRKSSWPALAFFSELDPARPARPTLLSLFFALGLSHSKSKGRKSGRATKRGKTIAAKDVEINERAARSRRSLRVLVIKP